MLLKALLQWVCVAGGIKSVLAVSTPTYSISTPVEAVQLPEETSKLDPRATQPPQAIHFIGFTNAQIAIVRRAIEDAAWLGQMGSQQLQGLTSVDQLSPEFRTYFGHHYTDGNMAAIRVTVDRIANILTNNIIGFVVYAPAQPSSHAHAMASVRGRTMTIYPWFFDQSHPDLEAWSYVPGDNTDFNVLRITANRGMSIAHEITHYRDNNFGQGNRRHIGDLTWEDVNVPGTPTYDGNYPTSAVTIYSPQNAHSLGDLNQAAAMQNAANYQWYLYAIYVARYLASTLIARPAFPKGGNGGKMMVRALLGEMDGGLEKRWQESLVV